MWSSTRAPAFQEKFGFVDPRNEGQGRPGPLLQWESWWPAAPGRQRPSHPRRASRCSAASGSARGAAQWACTLLRRLDELHLEVDREPWRTQSVCPSGPLAGLDVPLDDPRRSGFSARDDAEAASFNPAISVNGLATGQAPRSRCDRRSVPLLPPFGAWARMEMSTFGNRTTSERFSPMRIAVPPSASSRNSSSPRRL